MTLHAITTAVTGINAASYDTLWAAVITGTVALVSAVIAAWTASRSLTAFKVLGDLAENRDPYISKKAKARLIEQLDRLELAPATRLAYAFLGVSLVCAGWLGFRLVGSADPFSQWALGILVILGASLFVLQLIYLIAPPDKTRLNNSSITCFDCIALVAVALIVVGFTVWFCVFN